jgi:chromate reductase, NAD(P)H dehydrogenase (quinone)
MKFLFLLFCFPLLAQMKVTAVCGSLREGSYNKQLMREAVKFAEEMGAAVTVVDLKDYPMPFYDADLEASKGMPKMAKQFRELLLASDAIIIAAPEYNGSISAVLKNAIDWASREPEGGFSVEAFQGKKFALMSASPGRLGGARGLGHLRFILAEVLGGEVIEKQASFGRVFEGFDKKELSSLKEEISQLLKH